MLLPGTRQLETNEHFEAVILRNTRESGLRLPLCYPLV
jgi:hypothetical protein